MNKPAASPKQIPAPASAEELVSQLFTHAGWNVRAEAQNDERRADFVAERADVRYAVDVVSVPRGSSVPLEQPWSMASLRSRAAANDELRPLAIIVAPRVSESAVQRLLAFRNLYAPDVALGVIDSEGLRYFSEPELQALNAEPDHRRISAASRRAPAKNLFSDLNQWLIKVLLAPELPDRLIGAPRERYRNATELAKSGNCSVMSAHRCIEELKSEGFLDSNSRHLQLVRREQLFSRWQRAKSHAHADAPFRMLIKRDVRHKLGHYFPISRVCLGLFAAADELGLGFVSGVPTYVLADRLSVLPGAPESQPGAAELMPAEDGAPVDLVVRVPKAVKSAMRGVVKPKGVPCSDVIQTWLDVSNHASRGAEQAELIWETYLRKLVAAE